MKTIAGRSGMACVLLTLAMSAGAASEETQPAAASDAPLTIVKHGAMTQFQAVELKPMVAEDGQAEQGSGETNQLRFVTGEEAEQHLQRIKERFADPAQRPALRAEQRAFIQEQYSHAGRVLGLDETKERELIDLLTDQQLERQEQMYKRPRVPFDSVGQAEETTRQMDALSKLLGEEGVEQFQAYTMTLGERRQVEMFSARLSSSNALSRDQAERLIVLLQERTRQTVESVQSSRWMMGTWERREMPSREQLQRESQLNTIATNERSWRGRRVVDREIEAKAAAFLTPAQLSELSKYHAEERERSQRWIESARAQAGLDPKIPEQPWTPAGGSEQPRVAAGAQLQIEIRLKVNRAEPVVVTQTVRNGESFTFEAAEGLTAEAKPVLYEDHWLDLAMTFYEQGVTGKHRLPGGTAFAVRTRMPDGTPSGGGGGGTVITGRKGYAIDATINATPL